MLNLSLSDLINLEDWQKVQDAFSDVLETSLRTVSLGGEPFSRTSRPSRLCSEIFPRIPKSEQLCGYCLAKEDVKYPVLNIKEVSSFKCPLSLDVFAVPIKAVGDKIVAYIIIGPLILKARRDRSEYAQEAERLGLGIDDLMDALIEINVFSHSKARSMAGLLENIFSYMVQTGYHKKRLGEIAPEVVEMDPLFSRYYEEKILGSLLNSCLMALDADSGSIMTLDKKTDSLHIKVASKLDDDVVSKTEVKMGEGIAGLAAATSQPILLPKDEDKNNLSSKMNRKFIKSSMIMPFSKGSNPEVYGVINLNVIRKKEDFSDRDIAVVKELVNMASVALIPLQPTQ